MGGSAGQCVGDEVRITGRERAGMGLYGAGRHIRVDIIPL